MKKILLFFLTIILLVFSFKPLALAQQATSSAETVCNVAQCQNQNLTCQQCVQYLSGQIAQAQSQAQTLSSQIQSMDSQIALYQGRIAAAKQEMAGLIIDINTTQQQINTLQTALKGLIKVLVNRIVATYEVGSIQPLQVLLTSGNAQNFLTRLNYLKLVQTHDKQLLYDTQQAKVDYSSQQNIFEQQKQQVQALQNQLEAYNTQLSQEEQSEKVLLAQTQGSEATYASLLSQAQAQLSALASFATSQAAGQEVLPHQTLSDSFGPYYNQRDAQWANDLIGGSSYAIWEVGCLITDYAMVSSHYGSIMTPDQVANTDSYFFSNTAEFNQPGPAPAGHSVTYESNPSIGELQSDVNNGDVVIAGLSDNGGPYPEHYSDHWVVLLSVNGNTFNIDDPWNSGAMNVSLSDNYSGWTIIEARIYN